MKRAKTGRTMRPVFFKDRKEKPLRPASAARTGKGRRKDGKRKGAFSRIRLHIFMDTINFALFSMHKLRHLKKVLLVNAMLLQRKSGIAHTCITTSTTRGNHNKKEKNRSVFSESQIKHMEV